MSPQSARNWPKKAKKAMRSEIPHTSGFGWLKSVFGPLTWLGSLELVKIPPKVDRCPLVSYDELFSEAEPWCCVIKEDIQELTAIIAFSLRVHLPELSNPSLIEQGFFFFFFPFSYRSTFKSAFSSTWGFAWNNTIQGRVQYSKMKLHCTGKGANFKRLHMYTSSNNYEV